MTQRTVGMLVLLGALVLVGVGTMIWNGNAQARGKADADRFLCQTGFEQHCFTDDPADQRIPAIVVFGFSGFTGLAGVILISTAPRRSKEPARRSKEPARRSVASFDESLAALRTMRDEGTLTAAEFEAAARRLANGQNVFTSGIGARKTRSTPPPER